VALAAAVATVQVLQEEKLVENAALMGYHLIRALRSLQNQYPALGDVRGRGLMVAAEFKDSATAKAVQQACLRRNLLLLTCGTYENVIRWIPPLIVNAAQVDEAVSIFKEALHEIS
jgi:4-aminobutyrate aminotransferase-like enzyme